MLEHDFEESIGYWVCRTSRALEQALNEELTPHGITYRQWQVLCWLAIDGPLTQRELADRLRVEAPTVVGILDSMERRGWIRREAAKGDRRKKRIVPTRQAQSVWNQIATCARRVRARATSGITPEDLETVKRVMRQIQDNLNRKSDCQGQAS